jgi:hypothetical protein
MNSEERSCLTKVRHKSETTALKALSGTLRAYPEHRTKIHPYPCRFCGGWHIGRVEPPLMKIRRLKSK